MERAASIMSHSGNKCVFLCNTRVLWNHVLRHTHAVFLLTSVLCYNGHIRAYVKTGGPDVT